MSLSEEGVWQVGVWAQTVWADGVWREGEFVSAGNISINQMIVPFDKKTMHPLSVGTVMTIDYINRKMTL